MQRVIMKSEIHRATERRATLDFGGSCRSASALMRVADNDFAPTMMRVDAGNRVREQAAIA